MKRIKILKKMILLGVVILCIGINFSSANSYVVSSKNLIKSDIDNISNFYDQFSIQNKKIIEYEKIKSTLTMSDQVIFNLGYSVKQTTDDGYIVAGTTEGYFYDDEEYFCYALLVKFNASGGKEWDKAYYGNTQAFGYDVIQTIDGGFILVGATSSPSGTDSCVYILKTDANGNKIWEQDYAIRNNSIGLSIGKTLDQGYFISGISMANFQYTQPFLMKTDSNGNMIWNKTYDLGKSTQGLSSQLTIDGGFIIAGFQSSDTSGSDAVLLKTNADGEKIWNKTYSKSQYMQAYAVEQTNDTGYILTGETEDPLTQQPCAFLLKTDAYGNETWITTYAGQGVSSAMSVQQTTDNGYIISGHTCENTTLNGNALLLKTDYNGVEIWNTTISLLDYTFACDLEETKDLGCIITGFTMSIDFTEDDLIIYGFLVKTDSTGNPYGNTTFGWTGKPFTVDAHGPYNGVINNEIQFNGNASDGTPPYSYFWSFGDGDFSTEQNPKHSYNTTGNYTVILIVNDNLNNIAQNRTKAKITSMNDVTPPNVAIVSPKTGFYFFNRFIQVISIQTTCIIGGIDITASATDDQTGIKEVRFYIDGLLQKTVNTTPYKWTWNEVSFLSHTIKVVAVDNAGNTKQDSKPVIIINPNPKRQYGLITGHIVNSNNLSIAGVNVTVSNGSYTKTTYTHRIPGINRGEFKLWLPSGEYYLEVSKNGFKTTGKQINVGLGQNEKIEIVLERE